MHRYKQIEYKAGATIEMHPKEIPGRRRHTKGKEDQGGNTGGQHEAGSPETGQKDQCEL